MKWYKHPKLYDAFELFVAEQNERLPNKETLSQVTFSEAFQQRMRQMTARRKWGYYTLFGTAGRRVASILVALLVATSVATISVDAIREPVTRFFIRVFRTHTVIHVDNDNIPVDESEMVLHAPTYIPEGYNLEQEETMDSVYNIIYSTSAGKIIKYTQFWESDFSSNINTENTEYTQIVIGDYQGVTYTKNGFTSVMFWNHEYHFTLSGDLAIEELMKVASSIEKVDKDDGESMVLHAPTYIPEGYALTRTVEIDGLYSLHYTNENGDEIRYSQDDAPDGTLNIDTEGTTYREIKVGEHPGIITIKERRVILAYWTDRYSFRLVADNCTEEEIMKMALSIEKVDKAEATPPTE